MSTGRMTGRRFNLMLGPGAFRYSQEPVPQSSPGDVSAGFVLIADADAGSPDELRTSLNIRTDRAVEVEGLLVRGKQLRR